jgi:hypothetical protein
MRGNSHPIICRYGSPLDGIRSIAFLAKGLACSSVCRLSFGSAIHSRMIFRRVSCSGFMLKILCSKRWSDGSIIYQARLWRPRPQLPPAFVFCQVGPAGGSLSRHRSDQGMTSALFLISYSTRCPSLSDADLTSLPIRVCHQRVLASL